MSHAQAISSQDETKLRTFVATPTDLINSETWKNLSGNAVKVFATLRSYSDGYYKPCWPSVDRLVQHTGLARNTVNRCLDELVAYNLIEIYQDRRRSSEYHFSFDYAKTPIFESNSQLIPIKSAPKAKKQAEVSNSAHACSNSDTQVSKFDGDCQNLTPNKKDISRNKELELQQQLEQLEPKESPVVVSQDKALSSVPETNQEEQKEPPKPPKPEIIDGSKDVLAQHKPEIIESFAEKSGIPYPTLKWLIRKHEVTPKRIQILTLVLSERKLNNPGGYIRRAIEEKWTFESIEKKLKEKAQKASKLKEQQDKRKKQELMNKQFQAQQKHKAQVFQELEHKAPDVLKSLREEITASARAKILPKSGFILNRIVEGRLYLAVCEHLGCDPLRVSSKE